MGGGEDAGRCPVVARESEKVQLDRFVGITGEEVQFGDAVRSIWAAVEPRATSEMPRAVLAS